MALFENVDFNSVIDSFADIGGFDVVLPFILVFAVVFAILRKISLFGENKNVDAIVSLILAAFLISSTEIVNILTGFLPRVSMIVLVLLMLILVVGIFFVIGVFVLVIWLIVREPGQGGQGKSIGNRFEDLVKGLTGRNRHP